MLSLKTGIATTLCGLFIFLTAGAASAQQRSIEEQRRFANFLKQYDLVQAMKARAAAGAGVLRVNPAFQRSDIYAYPQQAGFPPAHAGNVFEPWPYVPGDVWGYRYYDGARQPIGQHQVQTAPDRWESYPVYPEDLIQRPSPLSPPPLNIQTEPPAVAPLVTPPVSSEPRGVRGF